MASRVWSSSVSQREEDPTLELESAGPEPIWEEALIVIGRVIHDADDALEIVHREEPLDRPGPESSPDSEEGGDAGVLRSATL